MVMVTVGHLRTGARVARPRCTGLRGTDDSGTFCLAAAVGAGALTAGLGVTAAAGTDEELTGEGEGIRSDDELTGEIGCDEELATGTAGWGRGAGEEEGTELELAGREGEEEEAKLGRVATGTDGCICCQSIRARKNLSSTS